MRNLAQFWDRLADGYAAQPIADENSYAQKLAETRALLKPDWEMLELGCGTGNTALAHAPHVAHVEAVDISDAMLAFGRKRAAREHVDNITFTRAAFDDFAPKRGYDAVLMLSLIHLIPDWRGAIDKAWELTRPGGIFVSSTTCMGSAPLHERLALKLMRAAGKAPPIAVFRPEALMGAIATRGFDIETAWRPRPRAAQFIIARRPA